MPRKIRPRANERSKSASRETRIPVLPVASFDIDQKDYNSNNIYSKPHYTQPTVLHKECLENSCSKVLQNCIKTDYFQNRNELKIFINTLILFKKYLGFEI